MNKKIALFLLPLLTQGGGAEKYFIEPNIQSKLVQTKLFTRNTLK